MFSNSDDKGKTFKDVFKFYKRKNYDSTKVYDFSQYLFLGQDLPLQDIVEPKTLHVDHNLDWESYGMIQPQDWKIYTFKLKPGLIYIKNPFKPYGQRYWIARCLRDFTKRPNHLNISAHNILKEEDEWWEFCLREHDTKWGQTVLKKLRWATLGYHHNWDSKEYSENAKGEFPDDLRVLCEAIGELLGFHGFNAQAAIINMYHEDSSLSGHTDHSEIDLSAPLFSFSFGQSAIFLIGGTTIEEEPIPLLLESGDIIIMSAEARLCYHGVPRILNCRKKTWIIQPEEMGRAYASVALNNDVLSNITNLDFWHPYELYVSYSRINMNVRQVLPSGQTKLI